MTTPTSPKVKTIEEILERFDEEFPDGVMEEYNKKTDTWENDITDEVKAFLRTAIIEVLESVVPPKKHKLENNETLAMPSLERPEIFFDGYGVCRQQLLENISKIKENDQT